MWEQFKKYRIVVLIGFIFLAALIFYSLNLKNKERANPFERAVLTITAPVIGVVDHVNRGIMTIWNDYIDLVGVRQENLQLRETVKRLNTRLIRDQEAVLANDRLQKLLNLKAGQPNVILAAHVVGEDSSPWFRTILIDRGSVDGLQEGMPVIAANGVVGQLIKVAAGSSRVLLVTDHASSIAGITQRSRGRGVVKGKGDGRCSMEFAMRDDDIKVGDVIVTSGVGQIFPKGLPVGEVTMVRKGEYGIFQTIELRPFVNTSRLEEVLILVKQDK